MSLMGFSVIRWFSLALALSIIILCIIYASEFPPDYIWLWTYVIMIGSFVLILRILEMSLSCFPCSEEGRNPILIILFWMMMAAILLTVASVLILKNFEHVGPLAIGGCCLALGVILLIEFVCRCCKATSSPIIPACSHCGNFHSPFTLLSCRRTRSPRNCSCGTARPQGPPKRPPSPPKPSHSTCGPSFPTPCPANPSLSTCSSSFSPPYTPVPPSSTCDHKYPCRIIRCGNHGGTSKSQIHCKCKLGRKQDDR